MTSYTLHCFFSKANPVSISADSKVVKVINSFIAEPIVVPHRIWSQETNITSECDCLSPHELSDSSDTDESYPSLPEKLKKIPSFIPTKQVSNRKTYIYYYNKVPQNTKN